MPVLNVVIQCFGAPMLLVPAMLIRCFNFNKPRVKAGIGCELGGAAVVGVAVIWRISENDFGPAPPQNMYDFENIFAPVSEKTIGHACVFAKKRPHFFCSFRRFFLSYSGVAAGTQFSSCQVEQSHSFTGGNMAKQGSTATQFHIVGVNANGENIYFHDSIFFGENEN